MVHAWKHRVVVGEGGRIEVCAPELPAGTAVEVLVVEEEDSRQTARVVPLSSLVGACQGLFATPDDADAFLRQERKAWDR